LILSPPRQTFRQNLTLRTTLTVLLVGGAFVVWIFAQESGVTSSIPYLVQGALVVFTVIFWILLGKTAISVHDEGVRYTNALGTKELEWHQVREYRYRVSPRSNGGGLVGLAITAAKRARQGRAAVTNFYLTLIGDDGTKIAINPFFKDAYDAIGMILSSLHEKMRPRIESEVKTTGATFGPLRLTARDLQWKSNDPVLLGELTAAEIAGQMLRIKKKGKMLSLVSVRSDKVPNVLLLLETMEKLGVGAGTAPAVDPLARVRI
jgi:hypothetical protein